MVDNDQVLEQLNKRFDVIEKNMATKADIQRLDQGQAQTNKRLSKLEDGQAQTNTILAQHTTALKALGAGQKELQETVATRADVLNVGVKVDKMRKRIEGIEEHEGIPNPDKN